MVGRGPSFVPASPLALRGISRRSEDLARAIESDPARPHKYENPSVSDGRGSQLETTGECFSVNFAVRVQPRSYQFSPTSLQAKESFWNRLVGGFRIAPPTIGSSTAPGSTSCATSRLRRQERPAGRLRLHRHGLCPGDPGGSQRSMAQRCRSDQTESSKARHHHGQR